MSHYVVRIIVNPCHKCGKNNGTLWLTLNGHHFRCRKLPDLSRDEYRRAHRAAIDGETTP